MSAISFHSNREGGNDSDSSFATGKLAKDILKKNKHFLENKQQQYQKTPIAQSNLFEETPIDNNQEIKKKKKHPYESNEVTFSNPNQIEKFSEQKKSVLDKYILGQCNSSRLDSKTSLDFLKEIAPMLQISSTGLKKRELCKQIALKLTLACNNSKKEEIKKSDPLEMLLHYRCKMSGKTMESPIKYSCGCVMDVAHYKKGSTVCPSCGVQILENPKIANNLSKKALEHYFQLFVLPACKPFYD